MHDDWYGHRDPFTGAPVGDKDEWIEWDHLLADAYQTIDDYTDEFGILRWVHDTPWVDIDADRKTHKFTESRDRITSRPKYKGDHGEYFVPYVKSLRKDEAGNEVFWTFREWVEAQAKEAL